MDQGNPFSLSARSTPKLQDGVLEWLSHIALKRAYEPDQFIINEGDDCEVADLILEGSLSVLSIHLKDGSTPWFNWDLGKHLILCRSYLRAV